MFKPPPYLHPTRKGSQPFITWCLDCITKLDPPAPNGGTTLVVAVDAWSKWMEYRIINPLDSRETARFLYEEIVCCYGVPTFVRTDAGTEFQGDFSRLCSELGIV